LSWRAHSHFPSPFQNPPSRPITVFSVLFDFPLTPSFPPVSTIPTLICQHFASPPSFSYSPLALSSVEFSALKILFFPLLLSFGPSPPPLSPLFSLFSVSACFEFLTPTWLLQLPSFLAYFCTFFPPPPTFRLPAYVLYKPHVSTFYFSIQFWESPSLPFVHPHCFPQQINCRFGINNSHG